MSKIRATKLREEIGNVGFPFWVRVWERTNETWIAPKVGHRDRCFTLMERLKELGYFPVMTGAKGTEGEWIIELLPE